MAKKARRVINNTVNAETVIFAICFSILMSDKMSSKKTIGKKDKTKSDKQLKRQFDK